MWIDRELTGYMDLKPEDLPPYRRLEGEPKAWNPYRGWQPIHFQDADELRFFSQAPIGQGLGAMEQSLGERREGRYIFLYSPEIKTHLMKSIDFPTEVCVHITYGGLWNVVDQVRNLILDWSLELEKAGIVGEDMVFTAKEKREAEPVTQQFIIQNVGVLGHVSDRAQVTNRQTALATLDLRKVQDFVAQARGALDDLPTPTRREVEPVLDEVEGELSSATPDRSKLNSLLGSIRSICEGAAGNLTAAGIVQLLGRLLAG